MINWLDVQDFLLIQHVSLNFDSGMTVLTGETGAGKSIIVDALAILLGDRASGDIIRHGSDRSEIQAIFDISKNAHAQAWLDEQMLSDNSDECFLRRLIFKGQSSRGFINGRPVPIHFLQQFGNLLVDIHSQHEHHNLIRQDAQRIIVDTYADTINLVENLSEIYSRLNTMQNELQDLESTAKIANERREHLSHQIEELTLLNPNPTELKILEETHERLNHAHELTEGTWQLVQTLDDNEDTAISTLLHKSLQQLEHLSRYDSHLIELSGELEAIGSQVADIASNLRRKYSEYEIDPNQFIEVQARLSLFYETARKYKTQPEKLETLLNRLKDELDSVDTSTRIKEINNEIRALEEDYDGIAENISKTRANACKNFIEHVNQLLSELGLEHAVFDVQLKPLINERRGRFGNESIAFLIQTNPETEFGSIKKVASGGELSRISLAIQVASSRADSVPSSIYDEVDVGIGGSLAEIVGNKLNALGAYKQVLCITHLPQVAVQGNNHIQVMKKSLGETEIQVRYLQAEQRLEEISRMLGGIEITRETRAHAEDMLRRAGH